MDMTLAISPRMLAGKLLYIVDDDIGRCEILSVLLRLEGFQTNFFVDTDQFLTLCARRAPDIVLLSLALSQESGLNFLRRIKSEFAGIPVIALAPAGQVDAAVLAMKFGANDVISAPFDSEYLLQVIRECLRKDIHIGAVHDGIRTVEVRGFSRLTDREREVLNLLVNGCRNKEVGRALNISPRTAEAHRSRIMYKLGAKNAADLLRIVLTS